MTDVAPPKLIVSRPQDDVANASIRPILASRRRSKTESSAVKGESKQATVEWINVDDSPGRRRRQPKRTSDRSSAVSSNRSRRNTESLVGGFLPKLSRILESSESKAASRPSTSGSDARKHREQSITRRNRHRDDVSVGYRRPVRHKSGGVRRRPESGFKVNPSLLSVFSSLTGTSERSSDSGTTITQQSYDCRSEEEQKGSEALNLPETERDAKRPSLPNVFDYMETTSLDDGHDGRSVYSSSSSSQYEPSEAGSSERAGTPSSSSTFPSPTATRHSSLTGSVAELRRKYDSQYATLISSGASVRSGSKSPEAPSRAFKRLSNVRNDLDERDELDAEAKAQAEGTHDGSQRSSSVSSRSSRPSRRHAEKQRSQEDAMRQHLASSQHGQHLIDPVFGQHRSHSASSHGSASSARAYAQAQAQAHYMAMQQYQYPSPQAYPIPARAMNGHVAQVPERVPVPDAPDLTQRTITGYEQLAIELSNRESGMVPIYRKFEYLNHRILLHLQDELSEMEEHLRQLDEIIAQMDSSATSSERQPASRRGDTFNGSQIHHQRTELLGRVFLKTEQYNRAMSSFATMTKDSSPAEEAQITAYQDYLKDKASIHEVETRFLQSEKDLIQPGKPRAQPVPQQAETSYRPTKHAALTCLPVALMLPLLLFALIPTLTGRLVVTTLIACGTFMVAATTRIRHLMPAREWAVCGAAYVLLMAAIAGCVPSHTVVVQGTGGTGAQVTYRR